MSDSVRSTLQDGVLLVEMVHEADLNALTPDMVDALGAALTRAATPDVRALVITGSGRAFSAGGDVKGMERNRKSAHATYLRLKAMNAAITVPLLTLSKPTVAAVNGVAAGAGMAMAMACDLRVVSTSSRFVFAFNRIGLVPDFASWYLLPRLVGLARAKQLALLKGQLSAAEAMEWGLATELTSPGQTLARANALAATLAQGPTISFGLTKQMMDQSYRLPLHEAIEMEAAYQAIASQTEDHAAARQAFVDQSPVGFTGK